jgi:hypothetical protein
MTNKKFIKKLPKGVREELRLRATEVYLEKKKLLGPALAIDIMNKFIQYQISILKALGF